MRRLGRGGTVPAVGAFVRSGSARAGCGGLAFFGGLASERYAQCMGASQFEWRAREGKVRGSHGSESRRPRRPGRRGG